MLILFERLWELICGKGEKEEIKYEKDDYYNHALPIIYCNTIVDDGDREPVWGQFVDISGQRFYDGCRINGCEWCRSSSEMDK